MLGARPSSTPLHHQCEGRPPAFQASRATRATNRAVASAACLEGPRGARYPICGCIERPAFPAPSIVKSGETVFAKLGRIAPRECGSVSFGCLKMEPEIAGYANALRSRRHHAIAAVVLGAVE